MARALASTQAEAEKQILTTANAKSYLWGTSCNLEVEYKEKKSLRNKVKEALGQEEREERGR